MMLHTDGLSKQKVKEVKDSGLINVLSTSGYDSVSPGLTARTHTHTQLSFTSEYLKVFFRNGSMIQHLSGFRLR